MKKNNDFEYVDVYNHHSTANKEQPQCVKYVVERSDGTYYTFQYGFSSDISEAAKFVKEDEAQWIAAMLELKYGNYEFEVLEIYVNFPDNS